jgi:preprotein translocase subunit SecG
MQILAVLLYILFVLSAIVLVVVILLQEGKGGGLTGALGTEGQQTFGVGTKGINQFTGWTCAIFLACALGIHWANRNEINKSVVSESVVPLDSGAGNAPPADAGGQTPPANGGGQTPPPADGGGEKPK